jgi:tRNA (guanine-N7-)-methyltransferase
MLAAIARLLLRLGGWTTVGGAPPVPKAVIIAAYHTSNWDGLWALIYVIAFKIDVKWFAKKSLFWFPLGVLLRALGCIPLDRNRAGSAVDQAVAQFENSDSFFFGLAPEGTRSERPSWKSGFYRIAAAADVPILLGFMNYREKEMGLGPVIDPGEGPDAVIARCRRFYETIEAKHPEQAGPICFPPDEDTQQHRSVRSFVRRSGRLTPSQQRALEEHWPQYGIDYGEQTLDLASHFGRDAPRVLEIGFGNGDTLVQQASENRDRDFLGIEVHEPGVGHCLLKARDAGVTNLRLIMHDAIDVLTHQLPKSSFERVNLYFPDPWPKKRHHKRRIVQAAFLDLVRQLLEPGGHLHIATDWANYAEHIDEVLAADAGFDCVERREHDGDQPLDRPRTKFEQRGLKQGHKIVDWRFRRID